MEKNIMLLALYLQCGKDWDKIFHALEKHTEISDNFIKEAERLSPMYCTLLDDGYPDHLKHMSRPPFAFKVDGDMKTLDTGYVGILGVKSFTLSKHTYCRIIKVESISNDYYKIKFSDNPTTLFASNYLEALKICLAFCKVVIIDKSFEEQYVTPIVEMLEPARVFVRPTTTHSHTNELIKAGAHLYDCEEDLDED